MNAQPPSFEAVLDQVSAIFSETVGPDKPIQKGIPLGDCGLDSLDLVECSFSLEEFFGFQFQDDNPIEVLDTMMGGGRLIKDGAVTDLGKQVLLERMPELAKVSMPADLRIAALPGLYTVESFARMVYVFYGKVPGVCPESGESVVYEGFIPVTEKSRTRVVTPDGNTIVRQWAEEKMAGMNV